MLTTFWLRAAQRAPLPLPPNEKRSASQATLAVRSAKVTLQPPHRSRHLVPVGVWAVLAQEINPPPEVEALEWMLLTTVAVSHKQDAFERLNWYARRWGIEKMWAKISVTQEGERQGKPFAGRDLSRARVGAKRRTGLIRCVISYLMRLCSINERSPRAFLCFPTNIDIAY